MTKVGAAFLFYLLKKKIMDDLLTILLFFLDEQVVDFPPLHCQVPPK